MLALLVRESNELTLEELAQILERDASSLSKHAARLTTKSLKFKELHHEIGEVRAFVFQIPECQTPFLNTPRATPSSSKDYTLFRQSRHLQNPTIEHPARIFQAFSPKKSVLIK